VFSPNSDRQACTGAPPAIAKSSGFARRNLRLRLSGGGSQLDEDGLPLIEFKLSESSPRFNVSLRCPFPVWRDVSRHIPCDLSSRTV